MRWIIMLFVLLLAACTPSPPETQQVNLPAAPQGQQADPAGEERTAPTAAPADAEEQEAAAPYPVAPESLVEAEPVVEGEGAAAYPAPEQSMLISGPVEFETDDGLVMVGTFAAPDTPDPWPMVILLHMLGGSRTDYDALIPRFTADGYAVLALDMRGHGETGGDKNWDLAARDLETVINILFDQPKILPGRVAIVGASIGSNMALKTGAAVPKISSVVLLSPGLAYDGVTTEDALATYGDRPLLIVASSEDSYAAELSQTLADQSSGLVNFKLYDGAGHGTNMFNAEDGLIDLILAHLNQYVQ